MTKNRDKSRFYQIYNIDLLQDALDCCLETNIAKRNLIASKLRKLQKLL